MSVLCCVPLFLPPDNHTKPVTNQPTSPTHSESSLQLLLENLGNHSRIRRPSRGINIILSDGNGFDLGSDGGDGVLDLLDLVGREAAGKDDGLGDLAGAGVDLGVGADARGLWGRGIARAEGRELRQGVILVERDMDD